MSKLPAPAGSAAEAADLPAGEIRPAGHILGVDFTPLCQAALAAAETAGSIRATYRPVPDVADSLPERKDTVTGLPLP